MAIDFNGSTQRDTIAHNSLLNLGDNFSLSLWMNTDNVSIFYQTMMCKKSGGNAGNFHIAIASGAVVLGFVSGSTREIASDSFSFSNNTDTHVMVTFAKPNVIFYKNGVKVGATKTLNYTPTTNTASMWIGYDDATYGNAFNGRIWDGRVYNRTLADWEANRIYQLNGADFITSGLILRHVMAEQPTGATATGSGSIKDLSGNGLHGTPENSPTYEAKKITLTIPRGAR